MKRTLASLIVCLVAPTMALAGEKVTVCHYEAETGTYEPLSVAANSRLASNEASPGDAIPGKPGFEFGPKCEEVSVLGCPTEGTLTETLGAHSFWYSVNGVLKNYAGTSESWLWWFNWGAFWGNFYSSDYLEFCVEADCEAPFGCYVP